MIAGLLEGAAFLAARVQLKLKHEFPEFTNNLLEQLVPNYLAPTPSVMLVKVDADLRRPGAARRACGRARRPISTPPIASSTGRSRAGSGSASDITIWPFDITRAEYFAGPGRCRRSDCRSERDVLAGLRLSLTHRTTARLEDEPPDGEALEEPDIWFAGCRDARTSDLSSRRGGRCDRALRADVRPLRRASTSAISTSSATRDRAGAGRSACARSASNADEALFPPDHRIFEGFDLLREYFIFPRKFLGFRLTELADVLPRPHGEDGRHRLRLQRGQPAARRRRCSRRCLRFTPRRRSICSRRRPIASRSSRTSTNITSCRTAAAISTSSRTASSRSMRTIPAGASKVPVRPLYSAPSTSGGTVRRKLYYTIRRLPRRRTVEEKRVRHVRRTIPAPTCSSRSSSSAAMTTRRRLPS